MIRLSFPKAVNSNLLDRMNIFEQKQVFVSYSVYDKISPRVYKLMKILEVSRNPKFHVNMLDGDALIDRSRSRLATNFLELKGHDIILFLDDFYSRTC